MRAARRWRDASCLRERRESERKVCQLQGHTTQWDLPPKASFVTYIHPRSKTRSDQRGATIYNTFTSKRAHARTDGRRSHACSSSVHLCAVYSVSSCVREAGGLRYLTGWLSFQRPAPQNCCRLMIPMMSRSPFSPQQWPSHEYATEGGGNASLAHMTEPDRSRMVNKNLKSHHQPFNLQDILFF